MPSLSHRVNSFTDSVIRRMTRIADAHGAINLSQGFPDFDPPREIMDALACAAHHGPHQYAVTFGAPDFREALVKKHEMFSGLSYDPQEEVVVTCGGTEAMICAMMAVCNPGDKAVVFSPFYENYAADAILSGAEPIYVPLVPPDFHIDEAALKAAFSQGPKVIVVCNPSNPCGKVFREDELLLIARLAEEHDCFVITDEVYEHMVFDGVPHISAARHPMLRERTFVVSSFGKTFHVTGWKIGTVCAPAPLTAEFRKVHQYTVFTANSPMQHGIAAYLSDPRPYVELPAFYQAKRDRFAAGLAQTPLRALACEGSYFQCASYADISELRDFSERDCCEWMTREIGVTPIPVSAFYSTPTEQQVIRFCFAKRDSTLDAALARLLRLAPPR